MAANVANSCLTREGGRGVSEREVSGRNVDNEGFQNVARCRERALI